MSSKHYLLTANWLHISLPCSLLNEPLSLPQVPLLCQHISFRCYFQVLDQKMSQKRNEAQFLKIGINVISNLDIAVGEMTRWRNLNGTELRNKHQQRKQAHVGITQELEVGWLKIYITTSCHLHDMYDTHLRTHFLNTTYIGKHKRTKRPLSVRIHYWDCVAEKLE